MKLIIEYTARKEETSLGICEKLAPVVRLIYFRQDEDTGAPYCHNIVEVDLFDKEGRPRASYIALHMVDWDEPFDWIEYADATENGCGIYSTCERREYTQSLPAVMYTSYMIHMMTAHALGYRDHDGSIIKEPGGEDLFEAYVRSPTTDHGAYVRIDG